MTDYDRGWILATLRMEALMEAHVSKAQRDVSDAETGKPAHPGAFNGSFRP